MALLRCLFLVLPIYFLAFSNAQDYVDLDPRILEPYIKPILFNLTEWVLRDALTKLLHAMNVQDKYKHEVSFELGTISSGIDDHFKHMLDTYRKYANMETYKNTYTYYASEFFNAYQIIKGEFNQIRMERKAYFEVVERKREHDAIIARQKMAMKKAMERIAKRQLAAAIKKAHDQDWILAQAAARDAAIKKGLGRRDFNQSRSNLKSEEAYKQSLRKADFDKKWRNFDPEREGVPISIEDIVKK